MAWGFAAVAFAGWGLYLLERAVRRQAEEAEEAAYERAEVERRAARDAVGRAAEEVARRAVAEDRLREMVLRADPVRTVVTECSEVG